MNKFQFFGPKVDFLIVPTVTAATIYLFYGGSAAGLALAVIAVASNLKPLQRSGYGREQLALVSTGLVLAFSVFLRSLFFESYCSNAPWAVNAGVHALLEVEVPCFVRGGYLQYLTQDSWRSVLRDVVMPISGLGLLFIALPRGVARRNGTLAAAFLLMLGLWFNRPLLHRGTESISDTASSPTLAQNSFSGSLEPPTMNSGEHVAAGVGPAVDQKATSNIGPTLSKPSINLVPQLQNVIPIAFRGEWNANVHDCGTDLNDSRTRIEPKRLRFYETEATVRRVVPQNARSISVEGLLEDEGETEKSRYHLALSQSGSRLTLNGEALQRCPSQKD